MISHLLLSPSFSSSTQPSSKNKKLSHPPLSLHAMIKSLHRVQSILSTAYTKYSLYWVQHTLSPACNEYSIHQVQHTPSTVSTEYCIPWVLHSPRTTSSQDWLSAALSQSLSTQQTMLYSILYIPTITNELINRVSAPVAPPSRTTASRLSASKYSSEFAPSWPPSAYLETCAMSASKCMSKLARSWPTNVSPNSLDHGLQVHLQTHLIRASPCISKLAQSRPPSASWNSSITASNRISNIARLRPRRASPNFPDHDPGVHHYFHSITASQYNTKHSRLRPPSLNDHTLQVHTQTRIITASKCISKLAWSRPPRGSPNSLDHDPRVHLWVHSITAWWNGWAGRQTTHRQHSTTPRRASEWKSCKRAVLALRA